LESNVNYYTNLEKKEIYENYQLNEINNLTPLENFTYALKSKDTKRQYPSLLNKFLCFLNFEGSLELKCEKLMELAKSDPSLFQSSLIRYCNEQKRRIEHGEITKLF